MNRIEQLTDVIYSPISAEWKDNIGTTLKYFLSERYGARSDKFFQIRVNGDARDEGAPFAAIIPEGQPSSGPYGGMSFVVFPSATDGVPALISFVIGTNGLSPDEQVLSKPGHIRKLSAIAKWLLEITSNTTLAWAKDDPVRTDHDLPAIIKTKIDESLNNAISKYGSYIYFAYVPTPEKELTIKAILALLDLLAEERGLKTLSKFSSEATQIRAEWFTKIFSQVTTKEVVDILKMRRFLILEGPPGTGKTRMAKKILEYYDNNGMIVQFHPGTTYETFIGGLAPELSGDNLGLSFKPKHGHLMDAILGAKKMKDKEYILVIDEINRADLAKVLGEGLFLFESQDMNRKIDLAYDFDGIGNTLSIPNNLYILGTMNSADRSTAIMDLAVRRRFGFVQIWPDRNVLDSSSDKMKRAFDDLFSLFLEEAGEDAFELMPGHSYFMDARLSPLETSQMIQTGLVPLLREYIKQGYVGGFSDQLKAYIDNLTAETAY